MLSPVRSQACGGGLDFYGGGLAAGESPAGGAWREVVEEELTSLPFEMKTAFGTKLHAHPNGMAVCLLPTNSLSAVPSGVGGYRIHVWIVPCSNMPPVEPSTAEELSKIEPDSSQWRPIAHVLADLEATFRVPYAAAVRSALASVGISGPLLDPPVAADPLPPPSAATSR